MSSHRNSGRDVDAMSSGKRDDIDGMMISQDDAERTSPIDSNFFSDNLDRELELLSERSLKSLEGHSGTFPNLSIEEGREDEAKEAISLYLKQSTLACSNTISQQEEAARIRNSFSGVHFASVKSLPTTLKPGAVAESRRKHANVNINTVTDQSHRGRVPVTKDGLFSPLRYRASEYKKEIADKRESDRVKRIHGLAFSRKPFIGTSTPLRLKNEDLFGDDTYTFPAADPGQGQIDIKNCVRTDFVDGSKFLHGPFAVSGKRSGEQEVSREEGIHWCTDIYKKLKEDWQHLRFSIKYSTSDEVIISFDLDMLQNKETGDIQDSTLCKYMTRLTTCGIAAEHRLKKRGDRWRIIEDVEVIIKATDENSEDTVTCKEVLVFTYMAPWCKNIPLKVKREAAIVDRLQARDGVLNKSTNKPLNKLKKNRSKNKLRVDLGATV